MKGIAKFTVIFMGLTLITSVSNVLAAQVGIKDLEKNDTISLKNEVQHAIDRGLQWFEKQQNPEGYWSQPDHPALTAMVLTSFMGDPSGRNKANPPPCVGKGYEYLLKCVKPDGGIYATDLSNYNTSVSIMALVVSYNPSYEPILRKARNFLVGLQAESGDKGTDENYAGGIGYGSTYKHPDLVNTMFALEAIYYTKFLTNDKGPDDTELKDLNWKAALQFIQRCQNLPSHNDQPWASDDQANKGGFVYFPGDSKAGEMELASGKTALRSYGSISYTGLLSYIYADLSRDDPRVKAVYDWLVQNYTLDENPGMGDQGLYYYYHTMAKALSTCGAEKLTLADGKEIDWRRDLALKLINLQREDGSWVNENGRWWQKDPVLVTSFAAMTLEIIYKGLR